MSHRHCHCPASGRAGGSSRSRERFLEPHTTNTNTRFLLVEYLVFTLLYLTYSHRPPNEVPDHIPSQQTRRRRQTRSDIVLRERHHPFSFLSRANEQTSHPPRSMLLVFAAVRFACVGWNIHRLFSWGGGRWLRKGPLSLVSLRCSRDFKMGDVSE